MSDGPLSWLRVADVSATADETSLKPAGATGSAVRPPAMVPGEGR